MSNFNSKQIYEELTDKRLPVRYDPETFTSFSSGQTLVGFKPYRGHRRPNGEWDVRTEGENSFCRVLLAGYGLVWAALGKKDWVELLGWGVTVAYLSDFAVGEQRILKAHRERTFAERR